MSRAIMAHMVAFYPSRDLSLETARALADGGARYLEVQFPFSDPTADGPLIQEACRLALERGFKVRLGFDLIREIGEACGIPVFIMGYANTVFFHGVGGFVETAARSGACGVIVPDLPPDYDEGLFQAAARAGVQAVPVVSPSTRDERLSLVLGGGSEFVYTTLRSGITGAYTAIGEGNIAFLERVAGHGKKTLAGFGISDRKQVDALSPHVHACVVGSALVRVVAETASRGRGGQAEGAGAVGAAPGAVPSGSDRAGYPFSGGPPGPDRDVDRRIYQAVRRKMESLVC